MKKTMFSSVHPPPRNLRRLPNRGETGKGKEKRRRERRGIPQKRKKKGNWWDFFRPIELTSAVSNTRRGEEEKASTRKKRHIKTDRPSYPLGRLVDKKKKEGTKKKALDKKEGVAQLYLPSN